jgi:ATP-binding cassette subfamily F protein uup
MISQGGSFIEKSGAEGKHRKRPKIEQKTVKKHKLSYNKKYALETLPRKIEALEVDIKKYQEKLAGPDFYATNPKAFAKTADELKFIEAELAAAEEEWLNLEILSNEIDQK